MTSTKDSIWRFAKALSPNDLGLTGSHQAGVLLPRRSQIHSFLPRLDESISNPSIDVEWWSPQLNRPLSTRYTYYNSKSMGTGTRNEYRLTKITPLLRELDPSPGSNLIFVFMKTKLGRPRQSVSHGLDIFPQVLIEPGEIIPHGDSQWTIEEIPFDDEP